MNQATPQTNTTTIESQLRVLIVGAGIAGLTLAGLLTRRGLRPVVIEKLPEKEFNTSGYMIGLMPLGARVLTSLDLHKEYLRNSVEVREYSMYSGKGKQLNHFDTTSIFKYGSYQGISRPRLINVLLQACDRPRYGTTVTAIAEKEKETLVTFSDNSQETFDLVVIADGIHSPTRELAFGSTNHAYRQTGWAGWAWFVDMPKELANTYREYWAGHGFMGLYIVEDNKVGVFMGGPEKRLKKKGHLAIAREFERNIKGSDIDIAKLLKPLENKDDLYFWNFHDCRSQNWTTKRVVLLGDAADGFLPTAGIGASMAMDSAAALDDELSRADVEHLDFALRLYENRQKNRVERAQQNSRTLGNLMFFNNTPLAWIRNQILRFYTIDRFLSDIRKVMEGK
jgi:2-polyprenyl-6-methoxyphenol hydroxylase-like FAD-dependent oxidoreductase